MPKYTILSYAQMEEHLGFQAQDYDEDPAQHCGFGMGEEKVREKAAKEKKESPEEEWSISTLLTDWDSMFSKYPQLSSRDTYSNEYNVMCAKGMEGPSVQIYPKLAQLIFNSKANTSQLGKTNGILDIYGMMAGIKEEKWAEMPEFAHYAKVLLHRCNLPLPTPRKDAPTRANAEIAYRNSIETDAPSPKNLDAMLGILAVKEPFRGMKEAYLPYQQTPEFNRVEKAKMRPMYEVDAHPILTAAKTYELRQNKELMAFLNTPAAVKAAKAGTLYETVQEEVLNPAAAERRREQREAEELRRKEEERQRKEQEAKQTQEEERKRNQALKEKRSASLRGMLERLGVSEADLKKKPSELRLSGSREYNNMARAALEAYQSASGKEPYDPSLDVKVRKACFDYTKGKKSVRFFESGRKRFEACLELMMSVSEPDEKGKIPEDVEAQFKRINEVRKTKRGDPNYVDPKYYTFEKTQVSLYQAAQNLKTDNRFLNNGKLDQKKYDFVINRLMENMPHLPSGKLDGRVIVDGATLRESCNPSLTDQPDPLRKALEDYSALVYAEQKKREDEERARKEAEIKTINEMKEYNMMSPAEQKEYLKNNPDRAKTINEDLEFKRQHGDKHASERVARDLEKGVFWDILNGMKKNKQEEADRKANAEYHNQENCNRRKQAFEAEQNKLKEAWGGYFKCEYPADFERFVRYNSYTHGRQSSANIFQNALKYAVESRDKLSSMKAAREAGKQNAGSEKEASTEIDPKEQRLQKDAEWWACRAYACTKVFQPDEAATQKRLDLMTEKLSGIPGLGSGLLKSIAQDKEKTVAVLLSQTKGFQDAQQQFDKVIVEDVAKAENVYRPAEEVTLYADDVLEQLRTVYNNAVEKHNVEKKKIEEAEQQRKAQCEKNDLPYCRDEIPESMHKSRDLAIRTRIAALLLPMMYNKNDKPDLKKLNATTHDIISNSGFMSSIVYHEIDSQELEDVLKQKCEEKMHPEKTAEQSKSVNNDGPKPVNSEQQVKKPQVDHKKKNNKPGMKV